MNRSCTQMGNGILYSTNCALKLLIQERFYGDLHYVWCSEHFDAKALPRHTAGATVAPSSDPVSIYRELRRDVEGNDRHSAKIAAQKAGFIARAVNDEK